MSALVQKRTNYCGVAIVRYVPIGDIPLEMFAKLFNLTASIA